MPTDAEFTAINKFLDGLSKQPPSVAEGMRAAIELGRKRQPRGLWDKLARIDWEADMPLLKNWIERCLKKQKLPKNVKGLWFNCTEIEMNQAATYFVGSERYEPHDEFSDWAA